MNFDPIDLVRLPLLVISMFCFTACSSPTTEQRNSTSQATPFETTSESASTPNRHLNILYWQAPSSLNPYLSGGTKDMEASSIIVEPLLHVNEFGELVPTLVKEVPTVANGGISADRTSITYNLLEGVKWSDGTPFTADDVVFTANYCMHEEIGCNPSVNFAHIESIEAIDPLTVRIHFDKPKPYPYEAFVGSTVPVIQKEQFKDCLGLKAHECTEENFAPIGTGPFKVDEFRANDVGTFVANEHYREPGKPYFQTATIKGGGDAASAARAVLTTGEYDYAWNLQVEPEILEQMEREGTGVIVTGFGSQVERLMVNFTNPDPALGLERRSVYANGTNPHPFLSDPAVREALSLAIDRQLLVEHGYGQGGLPTCNIVPAPESWVSKNNDICLNAHPDKANALLDEANWLRGDDGIRQKDGVRLSILFQTSTNTVRQGTQALIKQMWSEIGVETELRNIDGAVFFGADPSSPDTLQKFYADIEMYTNSFVNNDPEGYFETFTCDEIVDPENNWMGTNINRACSAEYDMLMDNLSSEADRAKRIDLAIQLNDIIVQNQWLIPLIHRASLSARAKSLGGVRMNGWDTELWNVADWYRQEPTDANQPEG